MDHSDSSLYGRHHPFLATIKERTRLHAEGAKKQIYHLVLDVSGSGMHYKVGDSVGVFPTHDSSLVEQTLAAMRATGEEQIVDSRTGIQRTLRDQLSSHTNITRLNKGIVAALCEKQQEPVLKSFLTHLLSEEGREELNVYIERHEFWDLLLANPQVQFSPQEMIDLLPPILPRFYSIASSREFVGDEVHLTVAVTEFESNAIQRKGVGSHFLCHLAPVGTPCVPIYLHPAKEFTLPSKEHAPIIMVGPGTGIAPFRGFMQERLAKQSTGKNWLFFGEWHKEQYFFYQDFWHQLVDMGSLRLDCAFSRDQSEKIYVQHKMLEQAQEIWNWLEAGAYFYVCGDADKMAKDVDQALLKIIEQQGALPADTAKQYLKNMRKDKRYLRDVY